MSNAKYPCKGCTYRHLGCHDNCEPYKEALEADHQAKRSIYVEKAIDGSLASIKVNNLKRYRKK